jgi:hypothetical protein
MHWTTGLVLQPPLLLPPQAYPQFHFPFSLDYLSVDALDRRTDAATTIVTASPNSIFPLSFSFLLWHYLSVDALGGLVLQPPLLPHLQTEYPHFHAPFSLGLPEC